MGTERGRRSDVLIDCCKGFHNNLVQLRPGNENLQHKGVANSSWLTAVIEAQPTVQAVLSNVVRRLALAGSDGLRPRCSGHDGGSRRKISGCHGFVRTLKGIGN